MAETQNQTTASRPESGAPRRKKASSARKELRRAIQPLASLKLTVVLFALSIFLIFAGTLAQVNQGIWAVMEQYFRTPVAIIDLEIFFPAAWDVPGSFPYPGGYLLGAVILVNLIVAHATRFKFSWRRSGIILTHAGLIVMVVSEFVTGLFATEGRMTINEGEASNYVEDIRTVELAVVDSSPEDSNEVVVVPEWQLRRGGLIEHEYLPFDIEVVRFMPNSQLVDASELQGESNPASAGLGESFVAMRRPPQAGADPDQQIDVASAYVTFREKETGEPLGTYLLSQWFNFNDMPQSLTVDGQTYDVSVRFERSYRDYHMYLYDFTHDKYLGTEKPKNFASDIRLVDPENGVDRDVKIYMNNPLRYDGETFYQSSYKPDNTATILQVVRNPGWMMPYISCAMVSGGLLVHFLMSLSQFLKKRRV